MHSTLPCLPVLAAISKHDPNSTAVIHSDSGRSFTYGELLKDIAQHSINLKKTAGSKDLAGERVAFLVENGYDYVVTYMAILATHAIAMPLSPAFPAHELSYILNQSQACVVLTSEKLHDKGEEVTKEDLESKPIHAQIAKIMEGSRDVETVSIEEGGAESKGGMMLYTSGTTNRPKGVLLPSSALAAQSQSLLEAWKYSPKDHLLHVLPLHHIHGTLNALLTPLLAGSTIEFLFPFNPTSVWDRIAAPFMPSSDGKKAKVSFFTVVPTIYSRLLATHPSLSEETKEAIGKALAPENMRLNISGSAALPTPIKQAWSNLSSGNVLLERYGMTEVGMALSCGLDFNDRVDGSVGWPLPGVEARLVDTDTNEIIEVGQEVDKDGKERSGEIQLRGATIFKEYFRNPEATAKEFVEGTDGKGRWFKTGDVALRREHEGAGKSGQEWAKGPLYFIQGRKSADIIKTGGEKVSALEVERELLSLPQVDECAVVPLDSEQWGQKVAVCLVLTEAGKTAGKNGKEWSTLDMRRALKDKLVNYKIPQEMKIVDSIPRNAMGKVNKKSLVKEIWGST